MLQPNEIVKKVSVVILCAGKGERLKKITKQTPKPLLRIKFLGNVPILLHTIRNLSKLGVEQIKIVIGYLGSQIKAFIKKITEDNPEFRETIELIDASIDYEKGPLYSFLAITKKIGIFKTDTLYVVIPGDTIFEFNLLEEIFSNISERYNLAQEKQIIFYRDIETINLIQIDGINSEKSPHFLTLVELERFNHEKLVKKIVKRKIEELVDFNKIKQIIPIFIFTYNFVRKIVEYEKKASFQTLREILNYMVQKGEKIIATNIKTKHNFYDIDRISDIKYAEYDFIRKKKEGQ